MGGNLQVKRLSCSRKYQPSLGSCYPRIQILGPMIWKMQIFMVYLDAYLMPFGGKE